MEHSFAFRMNRVSREDIIHRAKLAEKAERYLDMAQAMKAVAETDIDLSNEERNLFSISYKHTVGKKRMSWRVMSSIEQTFEGDIMWKYDQTQIYRQKIQEEIEEICTEVCSTIDNHLLKVAQSNDSKVFYLKMKGDYFRYQAEVIGDPERRRKVVNSSDRLYKEAIDIAEGSMNATHPIRLGLILNYSVFLYEVKAANKRAINMAREAFDDALKEFDSGILSTEAYKDSTIILQLLKDNVKMWSTVDGRPIDLLTES